MNSRTAQLIEKLQEMDTTLARVWDANCAAAMSDGAVYKALTGRQQSQIDRLRSIDAAFAAGKNPADDLYIISDGAFKSF